MKERKKERKKEGRKEGKQETVKQELQKTKSKMKLPPLHMAAPGSADWPITQGLQAVEPVNIE